MHSKASMQDPATGQEISEQLAVLREKMMLEMASDQYNTDRLDMLSDSLAGCLAI
jgi:hypothetical protein